MTSQLEIDPHPSYILNPRLSEIVLPKGDLPLDLETNGSTPWKCKIRIIALHIDGNEILIIPEYYTKEELTNFFQRIKDNGNTIVCHHTKFDTGFIYCSYGVLLNKVWCTMLASQIIHGGSRNYHHDLASCLLRCLHIDLGEVKKELQKSFLNGKPLTPEQLAYAAKDTRYLLPLKRQLEAQIVEWGLEKVVRLENKLTPVLVKMEAHGCLIDVGKWKAKLKEWEVIKRNLVAELDELLMSVFPMRLFMNVNYASSKEMVNLFREMGLPVPLKTESKGREKIVKESVDENTLENYVNENPETPLRPFIEKFKSYKEYDKLLSTYGDSFLKRLDSNNHIHTEYGQCTTTTARLNSSNPNLQNIPSDKSGAGSILREYFIAPPGYKFITSDMSGAEIALAADFSKDDLLMKSLKEGIDMHSELATISASIIYKAPVRISKDRKPIPGMSIIPQDFRDVHKSVTFSKFYKGGPKRVYEILARYINPVTQPRQRMSCASEISHAIDEALPKLSKYLSDRIDEANYNGFLVTTKLGRRRYFDTKVYGEAANAPIQGSNADAIKWAMITIDEYLGDKGRLVLSVHDETGSIVKEEYEEEAKKVIKGNMIAALQYFLTDIKADASVNSNSHWEK